MTPASAPRLAGEGNGGPGTPGRQGEVLFRLAAVIGRARVLVAKVLPAIPSASSSGDLEPPPTQVFPFSRFQDLEARIAVSSSTSATE
jgi:hypothetical protein